METNARSTSFDAATRNEFAPTGTRTSAPLPASRYRVRGSRARLQRVLHRVIFHLVLGDLFHAGDGHVFAGHAVLAAEDREELLAGSRLVRRGEFLRERLPVAPHAEAAADAEGLHGNGESRDWPT